MSEYITINVKPKHIKEGSPGENDCCAIALALLDSSLIEDREVEFIRVGGSCEIYKEWLVDPSFFTRNENPLRVHPNDLEEVTNFIDWFDELSIDTPNPEQYAMTFRVKELF
jgi:hypothetical protein